MSKVHRESFCEALRFVRPVLKRVQGNTEQLPLNQVAVFKDSLVTTDKASCYSARVVDIPNITIPGDSVDYLLTNLERNNAEYITIEQSKALVIFETETFTARLKKLALPFPIEEVEEILLKPLLANTVELNFLEQELLDIVTALDLPKQGNDVVELVAKTNTVVLKTKDAVGNEGEISVQKEVGKPIKASFSYSYFKDCISTNTYATNVLKFDPTTPASPILICDAQNKFNLVLPHIYPY